MADLVEQARSIFLGSTEISFKQFAYFWNRTYVMIPLVRASDDALRLELSQAEIALRRMGWAQEFIDMMRSHMWIPTILCVLYVAFVFVVPPLITRPWTRLNPVLCAWNLGLSVFSGFGAYHCCTSLYLNVVQYGFYYTICSVPKTLSRQGTEMDIWVCFFILSKVFELFDTVLKILMKKHFKFLHWYHHCMTCWLGWLALALDFAPGLWYAAINFAVHAPMYLYFFLSAALPRPVFNKYCRPIAPVITTIQITQMSSFMVVNGFVAYYKHLTASGCHVQPLNLQINVLVTLSYLVLFSYLFFEKYIWPKPRSETKPKKA